MYLAPEPVACILVVGLHANVLAYCGDDDSLLQHTHEYVAYACAS
jgi:hypothetical protein